MLAQAAAAYQNVVAVRQRQRDEEFWAMLAARLTDVERIVSSIRAGEEDEFVAVAFRLAREAQETADEDRRAMLATVLANSGSWSEIPYDEREELLPIVVRLTPRQVSALQFLDSPAYYYNSAGIRIPASEAEEVEGIGYELGMTVYNQDPDNYPKFREAADALDRAGLTNSALNTEVPPQRLLASRITPLGRQVLAYLGYQSHSDWQAGS